MNQRIRELAEQAGFYNMGIGLIIGIEEYHQKFAELLINECAETVQDFVDHRFPASEYPVRLRRYFGVEE
jgi:hypothetical protein